MKNFEIAVKVGNDAGNSELDMVINQEEIRQANVYGRINGSLKLEELDQDRFIAKLEDNLIISVCGLEGIDSGDYYVGNRTLTGGVSIKNVEVGQRNKKVDSDVCYINTLGQIAAYAIKESYKEDKDITDIKVKVDMAGALPITQYSKAEGQRLAEKFMKNEHRLTVKTPQKNYYVTIAFEFVRIIPEGVTTVFELVSSDSERLFEIHNDIVDICSNNDEKSPYKEKIHTSYFQEEARKILHIAIGEGTTEFPITEGMIYNPSFVEGINNGVGHAIKRALPLFNNEFGVNYSRQKFSEVIKDRHHKFHEDAVTYLKPPLKDEAIAIYRKAAEEIERANNEVDVILVYGGGSILMREYLQSRLEKVAVQIRAKLLYIEEKDAVTLEAHGLRKFVESSLYANLKQRELNMAK